MITEINTYQHDPRIHWSLLIPEYHDRSVIINSNYRLLRRSTFLFHLPCVVDNREHERIEFIKLRFVRNFICLFFKDRIRSSSRGFSRYLGQLWDKWSVNIWCAILILNLRVRLTKGSVYTRLTTWR